VLRLLFQSDGKGFDELESQGEIHRLALINDISYLKNNHLINIEKEYYAEQSESENLNEVKTRYHNKYTLTKKGQKKLAWYEYKHQLRKYWTPPWAGGDSDYNKEITEIIKENNYFGIKPQ
jgi:hypothetical protein